MKGSKPEESKCFDQSDQSMNASFKLLIKSGVHCGGEFSLTKSCTLIVGSDLDADIILQDESVAPRHCLILSDENGYLIRALDEKVVVAGVEVELLKDKRINPNEEFHIGEVVLCLLIDGTEPNTVNKKTNRMALEFSAISWLLDNKPVLACLVFMFVVAFIGLAQFVSPRANANFELPVNIAHSNRDENSKQIVNGLDSGEVDSERMARSVEEIMRLSGIDVDTQASANGVVEITGHFGDGARVSDIVQSRSIREIRGLTKIVCHNLDQDDSLPIRIISVVDGDDPYIVLEDGAIYYVGSHLPNGYELAGIDGSDVIVNTTNGTKRAIGINAWNFEAKSAN